MMGEPYPIGHICTVVSGPRRIVYEGDRFYFQREQRRYYGEVVSVKHELYTSKRRTRPERVKRCVAKVKVIAN